MQHAFSRVVVLDRMREYEPKTKNDFLAQGFDEFSDIILEIENKKSFKLIYRFDPENEDAEFNEVMRVLYEVGDVLIVVEEIHNFATPHRMPSWLKEVVLTGRHQGITFFATTQRPAELHKTILSQSAHLFIGSIFEKNDVAYLSDFLGRDSAKMLKDLKKSSDGAQFIYWAPPDILETIFVKYGEF